MASARLYSAWLTPIFDADNAIHVLMAYHFDSPSDLYYWGQNRRGSFEPLLGNVLIRAADQLGVSLSPMLLLSVIQYGLIGIAYFSLSSFLQHRLSKGIFALVWFLPPAGLSGLLMLAHPCYAQFALMGLGLWGISRLEKQDDSQGTRSLWRAWGHHAFISLTALCLGLSLWISELSMLPLLVLMLRFLLPYWLSFQPGTLGGSIANQRWLNPLYWRKSTRAYVLNISLVLLSCLGSIMYAKSSTRSISAYSSFSTLGEAFKSLSRLLERLKLIALFQASNTPLSIAFVGFIAFVFFFVAKSIIQRKKQASSVSHLDLEDWGTFFMASAVTSTAFLLLSKWVYLNDTHPRYFVFPFVLEVLSLLIKVENMSERYRRLTGVFLCCLASFSAISFPAYLKGSVGFEPVRKQLNGFLAYPNSAFIGDYWTAYLVCSINPAELNCTPHEQSYIRCDDCIEDVISTPSGNIYLIQERWLLEFPEKLNQFNRTLIKVGASERVGGYTIAPYRIMETAAEL